MCAINRRWTKKASILALFLLTFAAFMSTASAAIGNGYEITLVSHTYDEVTNVSTWKYNVSVANNAPHSLSHWVIAWCGGYPSIKDAGPGRWEYRPPDNPDPTTGQYGIKFDSGVKKGETVQFWFQLYGDFKEGVRDVAIKAGGDKYYGTVTGPVFTYKIELTLEGEDPDWFMKATATTDYPKVTSVTFRWYGPFGTEGEAGPVGVARWIDVDDTSPFEAQHKVTKDELGWWYVEAEFQGGQHPGTARATLDPNKVPWFTSLPLVMLVTVAFLAFLRRKGLTSACTVEIKEGS